MKTFLELRDGAVVESTAEKASIWVYATPDDAERRELLETLNLDVHALESTLDPDEVSRVEFDDGRVLIIWKRPNRVAAGQDLRFDVSSVGLFLEPKRLYNGPINGVLDQDTMEALGKYQETNGLQVCGVPTPRTREALLAEG